MWTVLTEVSKQLAALSFELYTHILKDYSDVSSKHSLQRRHLKTKNNVINFPVKVEAVLRIQEEFIRVELLELQSVKDICSAHSNINT